MQKKDDSLNQTQAVRVHKDHAVTKNDPETAPQPSDVLADAQPTSPSGSADRSDNWDHLWNDDGQLNIEKTVDHINVYHQEASKSEYEDSGRFLHKCVFKGKLDEASSKNPMKNRSLNAIANHPRLLIDSRRLGEAVKAADLESRLEQAGLKLPQLNYTHRVYLSALEDKALQIELAKEANDKKLSVNQLKRVIRDRTTQENHEGLPTKDELLKFISKPGSGGKNNKMKVFLADKSELRKLPADVRLDLRTKSLKAKREFEEHVTFLGKLESDLFHLDAEEHPEPPESEALPSEELSTGDDPEN